MAERIGWLGLGALGCPMATNLLQSGYQLTVYNRTPSKAEQFAERGAQIVHTASEVATRGGIVVSVLWDSDITESFVTHEFLARMEGGVHIGMCTGTPEAAQRLAELHAKHGSAYVEAPVFGRPDAVTARQLAIPYAGPPEARKRVEPLLTAMGCHAPFDMGEHAGLPTVIKQLGNFLIISLGRSLAEGLAVAEGAGADAVLAVNVLANSLFPMPLFRDYGKAVAEGRNLLAKSKIPEKDLGLFSRLASEHAQPNPIAKLLLQLTTTVGP